MRELNNYKNIHTITDNSQTSNKKFKKKKKFAKKMKFNDSVTKSRFFNTSEECIRRERIKDKDIHLD